MSEQNSYSCPHCFIGQCRPGNATYAFVHDGLLVSVPNMQADICDVCGYQAFDDQAVSTVWQLIDISAETTDETVPAVVQTKNRVDKPKGHSSSM